MIGFISISCVIFVVEHSIVPGSLVLYKNRPAIVDAVGAKYAIRLADGKQKNVRDKDIKLLHPGPLSGFESLAHPPAGNVEEAWELLQGEQLNLAELAEWVFSDYTPETAWAAWRLLDDGVYFEGHIDALRPRSATEVERILETRAQQEKARAEWEGLIARLRKGELLKQDRIPLLEVEKVAHGQAAYSKILKTLGISETPESAHAFLLRCGYWSAEHNPWPWREGVRLTSPELKLPDLPEEARRDLTHLPAWAIDDEGNTDPDDAIGLDGERIWVHVADVAALVPPDSHADRLAREASANLYLPEKTVTMLPAQATWQLGLGLAEVSPALSFGFGLNEQGEVEDIEICPSWVRVQRLSYEQANARLTTPEFAPLYTLTRRYRQARLARNAAQIDLPEVSVRVVEGEVEIRPLPRLAARDMVTDAMLMAGEAAARFALEHELPIPFVVQPEPVEIHQPRNMAEAYAYRRLFKPSATALNPGRHFGLGLAIYARATSPLRRYEDLLVHQQLRRFISGQSILDKSQISERMAQAAASSGAIRRAERLSNLHWKLVYLQRRKHWEGEAVILALEERKALVMIPELALECRIRRSEGWTLNQTVKLQLQSVDLPTQSALFRCI